MDKIIKKLWVDALRSGEYVQGQFRLRTLDNKFCCLGVLCDLYIKKHMNYPESKSDFDFVSNWIPKRIDKIPHYEFLRSSGTIPLAVSYWAGIMGYVDPTITLNNKRIPLSMLNDNMNKTFNEIANLIEVQL